MRVLHLLSSNRYSGAENVVCQIVHMFRKDDCYEMIYCSPDGPIREALKERDVNFVPVKGTSVSEFRRVILELRPDIIHAHDMRASFLAALACGKIPLISHIHNNGFDSRALTLKVLLYSFAAYKARHIFWVSKSAYESFFFRTAFQKKSSVLQNIIDPRIVQKKADDSADQTAYDIVFIGRMSYPKNPQRLITVLEACVQKVPELRAAIIGSGELDEEIQNLVATNGLAENVRFLGFMSNPYGILKNSKVMLMTSRWEGTPMCALEAMALGVPVVSTPTDGLNDIIENGVNGFLSNDDRQLAKYCIDVVNDQRIQSSMSKAQLSRASEINNVTMYMNILLKQYKW